MSYNHHLIWRSITSILCKPIIHLLAPTLSELLTFIDYLGLHPQ